MHGTMNIKFTFTEFFCYSKVTFIKISLSIEYIVHFLVICSKYSLKTCLLC